MGPEWYQYMDYYAPELAPYIYYFDSFAELDTLLSSPTPLDTRDIRNRAPRAYADMVDTMLHGWAELFEDMGFRMLVDGKPRRVPSGVHKFRETVRESPAPKTVDEWKVAYKKLKEWKSQCLKDQNRIYDESRQLLSEDERRVKEGVE
jgi:hypothetical protein